MRKTEHDKNNTFLPKPTQETERVESANIGEENGEICTLGSQNSSVACPPAYSDDLVLEVDDLFTSDWLSTFQTSKLPIFSSVETSAFPEVQISEKSTDLGTMHEIDCSLGSTKCKSSSSRVSLNMDKMVITSDHNPSQEGLVQCIGETNSPHTCRPSNCANGISDLVQKEYIVDLPLIEGDAINKSWNFQDCKSNSQEDDWGVFHGV